MKKLFTVLLLWSAFSVSAQNLSARFAKWKNNTQAVYTINHDDYGSFYLDGIQYYADTIAYNRGVVFTFGAITSSCDEGDWLNAKKLISHGHEIMNHTHTHSCSHPDPDCVNGVWSSYHNELDVSTSLIQANTNSYPRFFIWPYDIFDQASKDYLKNTLHYYGGRGGISDEAIDESQLNYHNITNFFDVNFSVYGLSTNATDLNQLIDLTISKGAWSMRELHGVEDASYAAVSQVNYRNHCDYIKSKVDMGVLWNANASEVTTYLMQTNAFVPTVSLESQYGRIKVAWNNPNIDVSDLRTPVTMNLQLDGLQGYTYIYQGREALSYKDYGDSIAINCYPHKGEVYLYNYDPSLLPYSNDLSFLSSRTLIRQGEQVTFDLSEQNADEYQWNITNLPGVSFENNGHSITVNFTTASSNGKLMASAVKNGKVSLPMSLDLTVVAVNDVSFACPSSSTFTISNQPAKKFVWFDAPTGGNSLAYGNQWTTPTLTAADTFYIAPKNDSLLVNIPRGNLTYTNAYSSAKKITVQQILTLKNIIIYLDQSTTETVEIFKADGTTKLFSFSQYVFASFSDVVIPVNLLLTPGDYYIKVLGRGYNDNTDTAPRTYDLIKLYPGGYPLVNGNGNVSTDYTYTAAQVPKLGFDLVKPLSSFTERLPVYAVPIGPAAPSTYTGTANPCSGNTYNYLPEVKTGLAYVYHYNDGIFDTTATTSGASMTLPFKDRAANGTLTMQYKNSCGGLSNPLTIPITVAKAEPLNFISYPYNISYPDTIDFDYTAVPAGTTVNWSYVNGGVSLYSQTESRSSLIFPYDLQVLYNAPLNYTVNTSGCSHTYPLPVYFSRILPEISILSPLDGAHYHDPEAIIPLKVKLNNAYGPITCNFVIYSPDYQGLSYQLVGVGAPYEQEFWPHSFGYGTFVMTVNASVGFISKQVTFYITEPTNVSNPTKEEVNVHPNPTTGKVYIPLRQAPYTSAVLIDAIGASYKLTTLANGDYLEADLSEFEAGIYYLQLSSEGKTYYSKVVKTN